MTIYWDGTLKVFYLETEDCNLIVVDRAGDSIDWIKKKDVDTNKLVNLNNLTKSQLQRLERAGYDFDWIINLNVEERDIDD